VKPDDDPRRKLGLPDNVGSKGVEAPTRRAENEAAACVVEGREHATLQPQAHLRQGKPFIGVVEIGPSGSSASSALQIQVVLNWHEELRQRVPTR
jgi:hypothetical protein